MAGRPPSEKTFSNMLRVALKEAAEDGGDKLRVIADQLVLKAMSGDLQAVKEIADRLDGKAAQQIALEHDGELSVVFQTVYETKK